MTQQFKNKIRAIVLLMVFFLNTVAGFACSVGVDMGYNTNHHKRIKPDHGKIHHDHANSHLHKRFSGTNLKAITDNCCSGQVNSFQKLDKSVSYNNLLLQAPVSILNTPAAAFFLLTTIEGIGLLEIQGSGLSDEVVPSTIPTSELQFSPSRFDLVECCLHGISYACNFS